MTIRIDWLAGRCPVQAEGTIDGEPFYFRARGARWSIEIGPGNTSRWLEADDKAAADALPCWRYEEPYGTRPFAAGWMEDDEARRFIALAADRWRAEQAATDSPTGVPVLAVDKAATPPTSRSTPEVSL